MVKPELKKTIINLTGEMTYKAESRIQFEPEF